MATEIEVCNWSPDEDADPATHTFTFGGREPVISV